MSDLINAAGRFAPDPETRERLSGVRREKWLKEVSEAFPNNDNVESMAHEIYPKHAADARADRIDPDLFARRSGLPPGLVRHLLQRMREAGLLPETEGEA